MFLIVVVQPRFSEVGEVLFDGKFGIFGFIANELLQRNSKSWPPSTLVTKVMTLVKKEEYKLS